MTDLQIQTEDRVLSIDRVRGLAIALMVLDHVAQWVLEFWSSPETDSAWLVLRTGPGRISFPLFMWVAGTCLARWTPSLERLLQVFVAGVFCTVMVWASGEWMDIPEILLAFSVVLAIAPMIKAHPVAVALVGATLALQWPYPFGGYHVGTIAVFVALGVLSNDHGPDVEKLGIRLPRWLEWVGQHPLGLYVAHLTVLCGAAVAAQEGWL